MNPWTGVLAEAWGLYRRFAAHFLAIAVPAAPPRGGFTRPPPAQA
jgi:hypothetical protein